MARRELLAGPDFPGDVAHWAEDDGAGGLLIHSVQDVAPVLDGLAALYVADGRYREAGRTLDRAIAILTSAKDAVATDWIKLFNSRAELHVRQGQCP